MMLSAKTFLIMEGKKILPRISDWKEKSPLHPVIKVTWRGIFPSKKMQKSAEGGGLVFGRQNSCLKPL